jgi:hypothetical protein
MAQFLDCVTAAALTGLRELARLLEAEKKRVDIYATARSRLPDALNACAGRHGQLPGESPSGDAARGARVIGAADGGGVRVGGDRACLVAGFRAVITHLRLSRELLKPLKYRNHCYCQLAVLPYCQIAGNQASVSWSGLGNSPPKVGVVRSLTAFPSFRSVQPTLVITPARCNSPTSSVPVLRR